ncbi:Hypp6680 [Branchiostoma lanceolatum]|uniref:Hypp6680 protein n=1 Tax=Branchiostoma lanceolatum TaxID=7740 RepID=A0A8K0EB16_BRALA|nr:Hypp6680 [Branchiostoma lanceolatum]
MPAFEQVNLIEKLKERFPQTELLSTFSVLDPAQLPETLTGEYGWQSINTLSEFYSEVPTQSTGRSTGMSGLVSGSSRMVVIPAHTADCERAFSCLKRLKTRLRSALTAENLNHLLMARIEGPDLSDFNIDGALPQQLEMAVNYADGSSQGDDRPGEETRPNPKHVLFIIEMADFSAWNEWYKSS